MQSQDNGEPRLASIIILAGGRSARMGGASKARLPWGRNRLLDHMVALATQVSDDVVVVGRDGLAAPAPAIAVTDVYADRGPLGGLHAGLQAARFDRGIALGCDMPFVRAPLLRGLLDLSAGHDAAVPRGSAGIHPLLAVYSRRCLAVIEERLRDGGGRMTSFFDRVRVRWVSEDELRAYDPELLSLFNINTWEEYERALEIAGAAEPAPARNQARRPPRRFSQSA
jgi:molybdopterin-guanine dinucleotide biosynthesis protein A